MTIQSIKEELHRASQHQYAVPLFDVFDQFGVDGILESIEEKRTPVILGIYAGAKLMHNPAAFLAYVRARAERTCIPVAIMLDHGSTIDQCLFALECGFTDAMYDGSQLPFEENVANTRRVVQAAHACGAAVEAELGHVGSGHEYDTFGGQHQGFTDPEMVEQFVRETGVDFLAIAFGNAHGMYKGEPNLDLKLVQFIRSKVKIPLVMHGGTGLVDAQYKAVIQAGIAKINLFTVVFNCANQRMINIAKSSNANMFSFTEQEQAAYREVSAHYFDVFEATGKVDCES